MSPDRINIPELLAPAGSAEALAAAIANGADAVYLGLDAFNARRSADNFTLETLGAACRDAHLAGVKVYLTMNTLILPSEMGDAVAMVDAAWGEGIDAVIVQDLGLLTVIRRELPHVRVHSSTQVGAHDSETIRTLIDLGVSRITLARETSLKEIAHFATLGVEIETFGHGALCICYSGQCLMSSLVGRRSANRGMCAQPCRLPWELVDAKGTVRSTEGDHLLSPKDLCSLEHLPALAAGGVAAVKLEGRMKSTEYVAVTTVTYRAALDRLADAPESFAVSPEELDELAEVFSRGFTPAYLVGERGNEMMGYSRPNNRGVQVGRVAHIRDGIVTIGFDKDVAADDTIEFWTGRGRFAQRVGVDAEAGSRIGVDVERPVSPGDRVFRVRNSRIAARVADEIRGAFDGIRPVSISVGMRLGSPLSITITDAAGATGSAQGPVVEAARTKAVTEDEVVEHVARLGGTPFVADAWDIELDEGVGIGYSVLHRVRREAVDALERALLAPWADRAAMGVEIAAGKTNPTRKTEIDIQVVVDSAESVRRLFRAGAREICAPIDVIQEDPADFPALTITPIVPRILHDREYKRAGRFVESGAKAIVGTLGALRHWGEDAPLDTDWSLNAMNAYTVNALADLGAKRVWLSPELSERQIAAVAAESNVPVGITVFGYQEVMVTEHCELMSMGPCDRRCFECERREEPHFLRDRKGYSFPLRTDRTGRSHIYNAIPLDLVPEMEKVVATGVSMVRLDTTFLPPHRAVEAYERLRNALGAAIHETDATVRDFTDRTTSGHFFRGVL